MRFFLLSLTIVLLFGLGNAHSSRFRVDPDAKVNGVELNMESLRSLSQEQVQGWAKCDVCEAIVGVVGGALTNNATIPALIDAVGHFCDSLGFLGGPCRSLSADLLNLLPSVAGGMIRLGLDSPVAVCSFASYCDVPCCVTDTVPEQVHISLTGDSEEMLVTWVTMQNTSSVVRVGLASGEYNQHGIGYTNTYKNGGWIGIIHYAIMTELQPSTRYYYQVGDGYNTWSEEFSFITLPKDPEAPIRYAVLGDLGAQFEGNATITHLLQAAVNGEFDVILHIGDISYADGYQKTWDIFMRWMEPAIARVPYMVVAGNHELPFNFAAFQHRFLMPGALNPVHGASLYYDFDIGNTHFMGIHSESVINTAYISDEQLQWIQQSTAKYSERRKNRNNGWFIAMFHRPLYCTNDDKENCDSGANYLRQKLEDVLYQHETDVILSGHQHDYERTYGVYRNNTDPKGPVHLINGAGGNRESNDRTFLAAPAWSAFRDSSFGFGRLTIYNHTHLHWQFYANTNNDPALGQELHDELWIVKSA